MLQRQRCGEPFSELRWANLAYSVDAQVKGVNVAEFLDSFPQTKGQLTGTLQGEAKMEAW